MASGDVDLDIPELGDEFEYHCFIAFSYKDQDTVDVILKYLREQNFKVSICMEFPLGKALVDNIDEGVKKSRRTIVLMSKHYMESEYYSHETLLFIHNNNTHKRQLIIPVCLGLTEEDMKSTCLGVYNCQYINYSRTDIDNQRIANAVAGPDIPLKVSLPCGNVAQGLVWSYYYGYLRLILPGLKQRCEESEFSVTVAMIPTMFILIPDSGLCHSTITDCDPNITVAGKLPVVTLSRAGVFSRPYPTTIYLIKGPDGEEYHAPCEYATPVLSMYEMCEEGLAGLSDDEKSHQIRNFKDLLDQVLSHSKVSCSQHVFKIIFFKADKDGKANVSRQIVESIKQLHEDQRQEERLNAVAEAGRLEKLKL